MIKILLRQSALYILVGGIVYAVDLSSFTVVVLIWPEQHLVGNAVGKLLGALVGFLLHKYVTFAGTHRYSGAHQAIAYIGLLVGNIAAGTALIYVLVDVFGFPTIPARIAVDVVVIVTAFLISRNRIFRHAGASDAVEHTSSEKV